jgi:hypothetical protein
MSKKTYHLEVHTISSGQPRPYADTKNDFIVKDKSNPLLPASHVKHFCESMVAQPVRMINSPSHFDSTETFAEVGKKEGEAEYRYTQVVPSTH